MHVGLFHRISTRAQEEKAMELGLIRHINTRTLRPTPVATDLSLAKQHTELSAQSADSILGLRSMKVIMRRLRAQ
jgi:hypothetical protein